MPAPRRSIVVCILVLLTCSTPSLAWSHKEHALFLRLAVSRLLEDPSTPAALRHWLRESVGEVPDMAGNEQFFLHAKVGIDPLTKPE